LHFYETENGIFEMEQQGLQDYSFNLFAATFATESNDIFIYLANVLFIKP